MPCCRSHRNGRRTLLSNIILGLLGFVLLRPTTVLAQDPPSSPYAKDQPMQTVLVVVIGLFFSVGFLSVYLRHYAWCLGINSVGRGGDGGDAWRRQAARGLDPKLVDSFPTFLYSDVKGHRIGKGSLECAVCINEFRDDEILRLLPGCSHVFHLQCIGPWLASNATCPVCRANLEINSQRYWPLDTLAEQLQRQLSDDESEPSDQITQPVPPHDVIIPICGSPGPDVSIKSPAQERKDGSGRMGKLPRSHSTGHSLVGDCERFTLRLPEEVRNKLVNANLGSLPAMISPRIGYRTRSVGCTGMGIKPDRWRFSVSPPFISRSCSAWSPNSEGATEGTNINSTGIISGPKNFFKSIRSPLNRMVRSSDIGERSSDRLWANRQSQELELEIHK